MKILELLATAAVVAGILYVLIVWFPGWLAEPAPWDSESVLFPESVLDFTVSDRCATYIMENMEYSGTEMEIAEQQELLRHQLQLPTRFMQTHPRSEEDFLYIITSRFGNPGIPSYGASAVPECRQDALRWAVLQDARAGSDAWDRRERALQRWWSCEVYDQSPPPTPDAGTEWGCAILRAWIPEDWLPPEDLR